MKLRLLISLNLLLLLCSWQPARAQLMSADDFFHRGAQCYITNNIPKAQEAVDMGLKFYPQDDKLKKLDALLKQQSQQQQQQQQNQSQQQKNKQQSQSQKSDSQKNQSSPKDSQDQKKQDEQKQKEAEQKKADQEKQQEAQKSFADKPKDQQQQSEEPPATPGQMTPEEAKRLLDAQKGNEQLLQMKPENKPRDFRRPAKDW
jgi:Ca-activated chloride channel family protein